MPDMPMPLMPTKWIMPMSVPKAFIIEGVQSKDSPSSCRNTVGYRLGDGAVGETDRNRRQAAADALNQVGEIARGIGPAHGQRPRSGIGQRLRVLGERLDLAGQRF